MLFEQESHYKVVESKSLGLFQHNPYSWIVQEDHFAWAKDVYQSRKFMDKTINDWILSLREDQIRVFVETLFSVLEAADADDLVKLGEDKKKSMLAMVDAVKDIDETTKRGIRETLGILFEIAGDHALKEVERRVKKLEEGIKGKEQEEMAEEREALIMEGERERMEAGGGEEMQPKETEAVMEPVVTEPEIAEPEVTEPEVTEPEETRPAGKKPGGQSAGRKKRMRFSSVALALSFLVPFTLMIAIFIGNGIYPFGKRSFLFSDMYHQYMPFFQEFMRMIKAGEGISYSWNVGIGSNFLALYVYYLASPFNWLAFLFPADHLMEFMSYAVVVKIGLAGLTAFLYLRSREAIENTGLRDYGALAASLLYAMSGFVAAYNWNVMWMDCVVLLPLILMGLERLVRKGKMGLYVAALAFCILTNFYISIMVCLFLVLYFIYLFLAEKRSFSMIWKFAFGSLLAGGLAAVLLVPEVKALMATDFGDMDFPKKWESYFSILDVLARHSAAITTERALEHWPNI
ncbi:MAG TPA: hypothetical protein DHV89_09705, partial [Ruminococcus sp.]|nr:hypothetical protein [Ruminococcus sp.]